jgi:steroid 5-alpha reductase family enzyme
MDMMRGTISIFAAAGWLGAATAMAAAWAVQRRSRNAGIVDVAWAYAVGGLAVAFAAFAPGWPVRRVLIGTMMLFWSGRLGTYLLRDRVIGQPEDGRYRELRRSWGAAANRRFFWFFQAQAAAACLFALPALLAAFNAAPGLTRLEAAAIALWLAAIAGESTADRQLARFKASAANRGRTCRVGLWRYSRHPNYFFEWAAWVAFALFAWPSPGGPLALVCPLAMLYLLFKVTGIPATEAQAVRTRGDDYRQYQQTTSVFVPWFPRARREGTLRSGPS